MTARSGRSKRRRKSRPKLPRVGPRWLSWTSSSSSASFSLALLTSGGAATSTGCAPTSITRRRPSRPRNRWNKKLQHHDERKEKIPVKPAGEVLRTCGVTPQVRSTSPAGLVDGVQFMGMLEGRFEENFLVTTLEQGIAWARE